MLRIKGTWYMEMDAWNCRITSSPSVHTDAAATRIPSLALSQGSYLINSTTLNFPFQIPWILTKSFLHQKQGKHEEAKAILKKIYPAEDVDAEIQALKESVEKEVQETGSSDKISFAKLLKTKTVRRGLIAGVGLQVFQQFVGINTVMYYSPTIVQLAGYASNQTALLLSLVTAGLNTLGSIVSIYFIDRTGRKKLLVISLCGVVISLGLLAAVFHETTTHSPAISLVETSHFGNMTCPDYSSAGSSSGAWDCMKCLKASSPDCGFCAASRSKVRHS